MPYVEIHRSDQFQPDAFKVVQDVIVELQYRTVSKKGSNADSVHQSVYLGWTGMPSQRKAAPVVSKGSQRLGPDREQDVGAVEIDAALGRMLGLVEGQKVALILKIMGT
jgi:peroxin-1